ncbi:protein RGF1 INDUCIBLE TRANSCRIPTION FACTOR 1-like [Impatiens glandulifera]|uniref:protein RGF1 INDUCIBLE TRANSCRIPTION FACTOR 1-like n=1 Tax=Impatiens glandulifera TaxID=253017 RepID=UPI001FB112DD|nr:protein RGF1 INDUCIBLE TRANSCRIPTION FACTOR 1-like [Impatiens glandulifera]
MVRLGDESSAAAAERGGGGGGGGGGGAVVVVKPGWLEGLTRERFFEGCESHRQRRKNEKNIFCLHCCLSFCLHCLPSHPSNHHPLLQVRRYVYHDVVRFDDLEKLIDCSYIQNYTINGAKVIFLNERAQSIRSSNSSSSSSSKGSGNFCLTCCRILQEPYLFCSLSCKVDYMVYQGEDLLNMICRFDASDMAFSQFEALRMNGDQHEVINPITFEKEEEEMMICNDDDDIDDHHHKGKGKKKSKAAAGGRRGFLSGIVLPLSNRRKGAPHRSPLS